MSVYCYLSAKLIKRHGFRLLYQKLFRIFVGTYLQYGYRVTNQFEYEIS